MRLWGDVLGNDMWVAIFSHFNMWEWNQMREKLVKTRQAAPVRKLLTLCPILLLSKHQDSALLAEQRVGLEIE